jgi:signal transduction histidine kinase
LALEGESSKARPPIEIQVQETVTAEVARPRLVQAITNVLVNAVESYDASDSLKPVVVRCETQEGRVIVSIEDSGCGMSKEALADASTLFATSKPNGTGFGLPLAIKIVESEHGGRLSLESTKGGGTVVRLVIPTHRQQV